jgi:hypothetical protein
MAVDAVEGLLRLRPGILLGGLQKIMSNLAGNTRIVPEVPDLTYRWRL